ncbi:MAG: hypothetical protein MUO21_10765, partial [Nitrososphaeraceae archaeon]|nr:hypothetical protein [Nitrososphaeraceae archaeon]
SDYKFMKKQDIYNLISKVYFTSRQYMLINSLKHFPDMTKKFINILLMDLTECNDTIDEFSEKLNVNNIEEEEKENLTSGMTNIIKYYINSLAFIDDLLTNSISTSIIINIIKSKEISSALANIINYVIFTHSSKIDYKKNY